MIAWEYQFIWVPGDWKELKFADGSRVKGMPAIFEHFNKLGGLGYELVSAAPEVTGGLPKYGDWLFVFKRPKEASQ